MAERRATEVSPALLGRAQSQIAQGQFSLADELVRSGVISVQELTDNLRIHQAELEAQAAELRESQVRLQQSAARFESLFQSLPVPAVVVDALGLVRSANQACMQHFGLGQGGPGRPSLLRWVVEPADRQRLRYAIDHAQLGKPSLLQGLLIARGTEVAVCDLAAERLQGQPDDDAVVVTLVDQTSRLDALRRLQEVHEELVRQQGENRQLAEVARLTGQAVVVTDPQRRITWVNEAFTRLTGWQMQEALGRTPESLLHGPGTDRLTAREIDRRLSAGLPVEGVEVQQVAKDGHPYWVLRDVRPVRDERGALVQFVSVQTDISDRRRAEEALRRSDAQQRAIFEAEPHALTLLRRDGGLVRHNAAATALYGLAASGEAHVDLRDRIAPEDRSAFEAMLAAALLGTPQELRFTLLGADGARVPVHLHGVPLFKAGSVDGVLAVTRDISDELAAQALRVQHGVAEAASRAKTDFIARMSHELRTPLNAMLGFAQLLEAGLGQMPVTTQRQQLTHLLDAGWHLLAMINDLLDLSRIEADRVAVDCQPALLLPLVERAVARVQPIAERRSIGLAVHAAAEPLAALVDPVRLAQVLSNLLSNAIKYNVQGGWIEVVVGVEQGRPHVEVADGGPGLTAEQRDHLFEPFNRLGAERSGIEGTGIGLTISRRLVELMGGRLVPLQRPGVGALFRVELAPADPAAVRPHEEHDPEQEVVGEVQARAHTAAGAPAQRRVLYIEDDEVNVLVIEAMIRTRPDWQLSVACNGQDGLRMAMAERYDVLMLDMQLPDISGLELRERLMALPSHADVPCLLLTADATATTRERALALGFVDVQHKPVKVVALLAALDQAAARHPPAVDPA